MCSGMRVSSMLSAMVFAMIRIDFWQLLCLQSETCCACLLQWFGASQSIVIDGMRWAGGLSPKCVMLTQCMASLWCQLVEQIAIKLLHDASCHLCLDTNLSRTRYCSEHHDFARVQTASHLPHTNTHKDRISNGAVLGGPSTASFWSWPL